jgi:molybdopterin-dependent oxidoreductase alpha subunit
MDKKAKISDYHHPAGGWGALASTARHLMFQGIPIKGAMTLLRNNQKHGFDCPGCAWPDPRHASSFEFCENGVKAVAAEATSKRVPPEFFAKHSVSWLLQQEDFWLENQGRLTHPMAYNPDTDHYEAIGWDDAFQRIAAGLQALDHPNQAAFYTSGRASNEAAFLYQLFVREFGTNNFPDCSNMCHEASGYALIESIGIGKGTVKLEDFHHADAIFIFGQNPGTNHPRMLGELRQAAKNGCKIVSINPLKERGLEKFAFPQSPMEMLTGGSTAISSLYLQPKIGGDLAVIKGMLKHIITRNDEALATGQPPVIDQAFIDRHTYGFEQFLADIRAESWDLILQESGLGYEEIEAAANIYLGASKVICTWGMGLTQHKHSVLTIQQVVNLLLLGGHIGRPGAGACPVRGHSNVQGNRTVGITEKPSAEFLDSLQQVFGFEPPRENGYDVVATIEAMQRGDVRVFVGLGGNFAAATPDTPRTEAALRQCDMVVNISTKLNRSHLVTGKQSLILPCLGRTEIDQQETGAQMVTVEDSMSMVHGSGGINKPASEHLLSEPAIVARMAHATLPQSRVDWLHLIADYDRIRDLIEATLADFQDYNNRVREPGGFYLPNSAANLEWRTESGKAQFTTAAIPTDLPFHRATRDVEAPVFNLMTTRSHDQYNTTIYGMDDRYRGVFGQRRVLFISRDDLDKMGLQAGQWVDMTTVSDDGIERKAYQFKLVEYDIPAGCIAGYYPETNPLVPLSALGDFSRTPTSKSIPVTLTPSVAGQKSAAPQAAGELEAA